MLECLPSVWKLYLEQELKNPESMALDIAVDQAYQNNTCFPPKADMFKAFEYLAPTDVKVVILGQDPYHGYGQANGLSFSVNHGHPLPPSLRNIYKELYSDCGIIPANHGDLSDWAKQGVFLLNSCLSVEQGKAGSHRNLGWERFTDTIIGQLNASHEHLVFILWGSFAQAKQGLIDPKKHKVITTVHPSPLSAHRGFFGSKVFSNCNNYLKANAKPIIDWRLSAW